MTPWPHGPGPIFGKAFAPEYQCALNALSVNSSLTDVRAAGARAHIAAVEAALAGLALPARPVEELRSMLEYLVLRDL